MTKKTAKRSRKKLPIDHGSYISTRMDWLELAAETATGEQRGEIIRELASIWKQEYLLQDELPAIERFLDGFVTQSARIANGHAESGRKAMLMVLASHEPLAMALGVPDDPIAEFWKSGPWPPTQADFDKRLANWLRNIIINHDFKRLEVFLETLRRVAKPALRVGVTYDEFMKSITWPQRPGVTSVSTRYWDAFWKHLFSARRLPTKDELDTAAEVYDPGDASRHRKELGFKGLPHKRRRKPI